MNDEYKKKLLVVSNSRTGSTNKLCIEVIADIKDSIVTYSTDSLIANSKDVLQADAIVLEVFRKLWLHVWCDEGFL